MNNQTEQIYLLNPPGGQASGLLHRVGNSTPNQPNLESVEDFSSVCRTCATVTDQLIPVFSGEGLENRLADKINMHLPIRVQECDPLPLSVCVPCAHTLLACYEMIKCSAVADRALRTRLAQLRAQNRQSTKDIVSQLLENSIQQEFEAARRDRERGAPPDYPRRRQPRYYGAAEFYRTHLDNDSEFRFFCEECNSAVDKKDFIYHMTMHILDHEASIRNTTPIATDTDREPPTDNNTTTESSPATNTRRTLPRRKSTRNVDRKMKGESENAESTKAQKTVKPKRRSKTNTEARPVKPERKNKAVKTEKRCTPEPTPAPTAPMTKPTPRVKTEAISNGSSANNNRNEFSDHSDAEEFAPLPDSVFEAIEDTQDCQSFATATTVGSEPQLQNVGGESEKQSPEEKVKKKHSKKTRVCPICSKVYKASSSYFYHLKYSHKGVREHECQVCGRKFGMRSCLTQHMNTHSKNCDYECKVCGKKFRSNASLYIHEQTHSGRKTFSCEQCQLSFRWRTHLVRHTKRHSAERAHRCSACPRAFAVRCDLLRHQRTHRAGQHCCQHCGLNFAQLRYLKVHMDKKHKQATQ